MSNTYAEWLKHTDPTEALRVEVDTVVECLAHATAKIESIALSSGRDGFQRGVEDVAQRLLLEIALAYCSADYSVDTIMEILAMRIEDRARSLIYG